MLLAEKYCWWQPRKATVGPVFSITAVKGCEMVTSRTAILVINAPVGIPGFTALIPTSKLAAELTFKIVSPAFAFDDSVVEKEQDEIVLFIACAELPEDAELDPTITKAVPELTLKADESVFALAEA
jgi:hypothetical protein